MRAGTSFASLGIISALAASALAAGCAAADVPADDTGLDGLALTAVNPAALVPGSEIVIAGRSFVDAPWGESRLRLRGTFGDLAAAVTVDVTLPARFVGYGELRVAWQGGAAAGLPAPEGTFRGEALLEVDSTVDGEVHASAPVPLTLDVRAQLTPRVDSVQTGVIFVNDPIVVEGDGFLLGGDEGDTVAIVAGCFQRDGEASCDPLGEREVPAHPAAPFDRQHLVFAFAPAIAGIHPGTFTGSVRLENRHGAAAAAAITASPASAADYTVVPPRIFSIAPATASLGQFVEIRGGGFVGLAPDAPNQGQLFTLVELVGSFTPDGGGSALPVSLQLVPQFVAGPLVRYVLNEEDALGQRVNLRQVSGTFAGTVRPVIQSGGDAVIGDPTSVALGIGRVKQVVWLNFLPSYVESLRHFGLRGVDARIRQRVLTVAERDYASVNVEFRLEPPTDFAYFAEVDLAGPDPNGLGLLGYDNSPGKDLNNQRLYDKIGGVNATTQDDGYPGYGGVFVESFFGFSKHPNGFATELEGGSDPVFDQIFDPFRPDRGGRPVLAADLEGIATLTDGASCPARERKAQIACAIWVLGSMIGTTMTHEVGHSLGLANPTEEMSFHDVGDAPNRLMDAGGARTFYERAELMGEGPAVFCEGEYAYLRTILPSAEPATTFARPGCF